MGLILAQRTWLVKMSACEVDTEESKTLTVYL